MLKDIRWLFFDIGSTLVDESKGYEHRISDAIAGSTVTYGQFYNAMIDFYRQNKKGDHETINLFHLKKTPWHSEDELPYPETTGCLKTLKEKYKIGIIANQSFGTQQRLKDMGLADFIDLIVSSAEEGVSKPDLNIFLLALERAGCAAEQAVMIGDRLDNDIAPAKRLGMKTVWIRHGFGGLAMPKSEEETPDWIVRNLNELCGLFGI